MNIQDEKVSSEDKKIDEIAKKEQEALTAPLKINKIKAFLKKVITLLWQKIHYPININILSFISILSIIIAIIILIFSIVLISRSVTSQAEIEKAETFDGSKYSISSKLQVLKESHNRYTKLATPLEIKIKWELRFWDWKYAKNGDPKYKRADCVGSVYTYLREEWRSNIKLEDIPTLVSRADNLAKRGELEIRRSINRVRPTDLIIISRDGRIPSHIGIVWTTSRNWVRYVDMNGAVMGMGSDERINFGDKHIYAIYELSYSLWIGDLMSEFNKK